VNAEGAAHVAAAAKEIGAQLCFISSDHVFDGEGGPYPEDAKPGPVNLYGRSKLEGERAAAELAPGALIARTALVWSGDPAPARNALSTLLARARAGERVRVPADQWTTPTYAPHLAEGIGRLLAGGVSGIVHLAGPEVVARDEFARRALASWGLDPALVEAVPGAALQQAARRPQHAGLKSRIPMMPLDVCLQAAHG
jgi:dTDP-4-dehydrorhamnose reductase